MHFYLLFYIIIISLFQFRQYKIWKNERGEKQVSAYLHLGRLYLLLFFLPIVYRLSLPLPFKIFYTLFPLSGFVLNILLDSRFKKACHALLLNLHPDCRIIILTLRGTEKPWNLYDKFLDLFSILLGVLIKRPLVIQQGSYLILHDILAFAFQDEIASHRICFYLYQDTIPFFLKRKSDFWKREADLYLLYPNKNKKEMTTPFPADKIRCLDDDDILLFPQCLISIVEDTAGIREQIERALSSYKTCQEAKDPGKCHLAQLICRLLEKRRSVTEYFYELMKLAEFMIHYRSLGDYEKSAKNYFDSGDPIAMGTFQNGIIDDAPCEPREKEAYIQALKYLNRLCTGKEGSVNRKKLMQEGRLKLVMVRNHFIGHGSLSYGISPDFVQHLLVIMAGQISDFFSLPEPVIQQLCIHDVPKFRKQEEKLYLLVQLEKGNASYYLDHGSGTFLTDIL